MHHTASILLSCSRDSNTAPQCSYCQQSHSSASCSSVTDIVARKHLLKTSDRCFKCLCQNHVSRDCKSSSRCQRCKKKHHTSICDDNSGQPRHVPTCDSSSGQSQSLAHPTESRLNPEAAPHQSSTTSSNLCSDNLQAVCLQTARYPNRSHSSAFSLIAAPRSHTSVSVLESYYTWTSLENRLSPLLPLYPKGAVRRYVLS